MSIPAELGKDALSTFVDEVEESLAKFKKRLSENPYPCGSRALAFAAAYGYPMRMSYTVAETAAYTGIDDQTLYREHDAGRIKFILPEGNSKGYRIRVDEVDRWMNEN